jgi:hypothetical protein
MIRNNRICIKYYVLYCYLCYIVHYYYMNDCRQHHERKAICLDIVSLLDRQWGTEAQHLLCVFLASPYCNYL